MKLITPLDQRTLTIERNTLQARLGEETENLERLRSDYDAECRRLARGENAKVIEAKQQLEVTESRIQGMKAEISEKERLLDDIQGREVEEARRRKVQQDFEAAGRRLAQTQATMASLRTEFQQLPDKIRLAEWRFNQALHEFSQAKDARARATGEQ